MLLTDVCCNLTHEAFQPDLDETLARARDAGVAALLVPGSSLADSRAALRLAKARPGVLAACAGVHPHLAREWRGADCYDELLALAREPQVVAIGETGLDYHRNHSPPALQRESFARHIDAAAASGLPMLLHQRDAEDDFLAILAPARDRLPGALAHCFTGDAAMLRACLELDCHIGITGWLCDERRGLHLRELVREIPPHRLLLETDAPYLLPRDLRPKPRGRRNEPATLAHLARVVAELLGVAPAELAARTTQNARALFGFPPPGAQDAAPAAP